MFSRHVAFTFIELEKTVPLDVVQWLFEVPTLVEAHPDAANWFKHKISTPWIFPSLNPVLSGISHENYNTTPNHTNIVETAHAGRNAETQKGVGLLDAILDAQSRDNTHVANLIQMKHSGVLHKHGNDIFHRKVHAAQRARWRQQSRAKRDTNIQDYHSIRADINECKSEIAASLACTTDLKSEIKQCKDALILDRRSEHIALQLKDLRKEEEAEMDACQDWRSRQAELVKALKDLRAGPVAHVQIPTRGLNRNADSDREKEMPDFHVASLTSHNNLPPTFPASLSNFVEQEQEQPVADYSMAESVSLDASTSMVIDTFAGYTEFSNAQWDEFILSMLENASSTENPVPYTPVDEATHLIPPTVHQIPSVLDSRPPQPNSRASEPNSSLAVLKSRSDLAEFGVSNILPEQVRQTLVTQTRAKDNEIGGSDAKQLRHG
ncbi:unnamed protein product [Mycena citricolor]|uniref:Uncharacterized protein n=1 Tax=Mycena citricolor TaxID=2018698 RepID=A0AAD2HD82_9AGAR|nr:unnamed protein product [Mycena citricolor]